MMRRRRARPGSFFAPLVVLKRSKLRSLPSGRGDVPTLERRRARISSRSVCIWRVYVSASRTLSTAAICAR